MFPLIKYALLLGFATAVTEAREATRHEIPENRQSNQTWTLIFNEDFNGNSLDTTKWEYQIGCDAIYGAGNLQCYVAGTNNVQVGNGTITITAKIESMQGKNFTSGRIRQLGNGTTYGKYIIRARVSSGNLLWPALWLKAKLTTCYNEIDILEMQSQNTTRIILTAWSGQNSTNLVKQGVANNTGVDLSADYHIYEVDWSPTQVNWLMDGVTYFQLDLTSPAWTATPSKSCPLGVLTLPANIILNLAVGGSMFNFAQLSPEQAQQNWTKPTLEVDYVKVYQLL